MLGIINGVGEKIRDLAHLAAMLKKSRNGMSSIRSNSRSPMICRIETGLKCASRMWLGRIVRGRGGVGGASEEKEEKSIAVTIM